MMLKRNRPALICFYFLLGLVCISILLPFFPLRSPQTMKLSEQFQKPKWTLGDHDWKRQGYENLGWLDQRLLDLREKVFGDFEFGSWAGTDSKGRDLFSRIAWGSRVSLFVGFFSALVSLIIGVSYGAISGLAGGRLDRWMMRAVDSLYSLPFIFVVIFFLSLLHEYRLELASYGIERIHVFYLVIGLTYWLSMSRIVRGQILSLKQKEYIEAARVMGASFNRILFRHLIPNVLPIVIVYLTLTIPQVMLFESFLSFLGLGIEAPDVSWGLLASDGVEAINPVQSYWWIILFPSLAIGLTLFALNRLGDGLRDVLDPRELSKLS